MIVELLDKTSKVILNAANAYQICRKKRSAVTELEPIIATDAEYSYLYAKNVLKGPFPLGEPVIAKSADYSYLYASKVLKNRF